jgi:hypothetical protein
MSAYLNNNNDFKYDGCGLLGGDGRIQHCVLVMRFQERFESIICSILPRGYLNTKYISLCQIIFIIRILYLVSVVSELLTQDGMLERVRNTSCENILGIRTYPINQKIVYREGPNHIYLTVLLNFNRNISGNNVKLAVM